MSDIESAEPSSTEAVQETAEVQLGETAAAPTTDSSAPSVEPSSTPATAIDPAVPHTPAAVTHESLLTEFVAAVRRDARGISNHLESLLEKAAHHFGL